MKITQKKKTATSLTLDVTATPADVDTAFNRAHIAFANAMGLTPEKGKTVAQVAKEKMGIADLDTVVRDNAMELMVPMVLDKKNIVPAYMPTVEANSTLERAHDFRFTLEVALKPEYELSSYEPIELTVSEFKIGDDVVEAEIEGMLGSYTAYVTDTEADPEHAIEAGDFVKVAIQATEDGKDFKGLNTDGRTYAVGAGHMPQGFDDNVCGMKVGQTKHFVFDAPSFDDDFNETTSKVEATVTIIEKLKEQKPELTDEWVSRMMPMFSSAEEMRKNVRKSIEMRERPGYDAYVRQAAASELAKRFEGRIADEVYESMMAQLRENLQLDLRQQGKSWDEFVEENGGEQQITMMLMLQTREVIVQGYSLDAVFRHFGLTVAESDILAVCRTMNPNADPKQLHEQIRQNSQGFALRESAERYKANVYIVDHAKISYA